MEKQSLISLLSSNPYPGRGIVLGTSPDGLKSVAAYFIMGRSENSRNRVFVATPDGIRTQAHDPDKMTDPDLIIYHPVREIKNFIKSYLIVTNGDQTDTIRDTLQQFWTSKAGAADRGAEMINDFVKETDFTTFNQQFLYAARLHVLQIFASALDTRTFEPGAELYAAYLRVIISRRRI